jgi:hypothetical protein
MPRNSRALLPAKIRTRLSQCAHGPMLSWDFVLFGLQIPKLLAPVARHPPLATGAAKPEGFATRRARPRQQGEDRIP